MQSLIDKLDVYDLFGYLIPGYLGVFAIRQVYQVFGATFPFNMTGEFTTSLVFAMLSYYVGVMMHEFSHLIQQKVMRPLWRGLPSERFLVEGDGQCSEEEKKVYMKLAAEKFDFKGRKFDVESSQQMFEKFKTYLVMTGKDARAKTYNAYYGMYRNLVACTTIWMSVKVVYFIRWLFYRRVMNSNMPVDGTQTVELVLLILTWGLLVRRCRRFGEKYVKHVFRDTYEVFREEGWKQLPW